MSNTNTNTNTTNTSPSCVAGSCADKVQNCASYGAGVCTDPQYQQWVQDNCCVFCRCKWSLLIPCCVFYRCKWSLLIPCCVLQMWSLLGYGVTGWLSG